MRRVFYLLVCCFLISGAQAQGLDPKIQQQAERAYADGDFDKAFNTLSEIPGLLGVVPLLDEPKNKMRAAIFFDLARIRLAQGDTSQARSILAYIYALDSDARKGMLALEPDEALLRTHNRLAYLRKENRQKELAATTLLGAAGRSFILPGWGQIYRGHRKRAMVFVGATAAAGLYWFAADRAYKNAYNAYRATQIGELNVPERLGQSTDPFPFQERFQNAESKASKANVALGILAGVWLAGVFDHVIIGPAHLEVGFPIF